MTKSIKYLTASLVLALICCFTFISPTFALASTNTIFLYDGSTQTTALQSTTINSITMTVKGFSTSTKTLNDVTVNGKTYLTATQTGGNSSTSKYITVETSKDFKLGVVAASNSSSQMTVGVSSTAQSSANEINVLTLTESGVYTYGETNEIEAGIYYITFSGNMNIAEISLTLVEEENINAGTTSSNQNSIEDNENSSSLTDSKTEENGDLSTDSGTFDLKKVAGILFGIAFLLIVIFVIIILWQKFFSGKKKVNYDYYDDDFDIDFDDDDY